MHAEAVPAPVVSPKSLLPSLSPSHSPKARSPTAGTSLTSTGAAVYQSSAPWQPLQGASSSSLMVEIPSMPDASGYMTIVTLPSPAFASEARDQLPPLSPGHGGALPSSLPQAAARSPSHLPRVSSPASPAHLQGTGVWAASGVGAESSEHDWRFLLGVGVPGNESVGHSRPLRASSSHLHTHGRPAVVSPALPASLVPSPFGTAARGRPHVVTSPVVTRVDASPLASRHWWSSQADVLTLPSHLDAAKLDGMAAKLQARWQPSRRGAIFE